MDKKIEKQSLIPPHVLKKKIEELKKNDPDLVDNDSYTDSSVDTDIDSDEDTESNIDTEEEIKQK